MDNNQLLERILDKVDSLDEHLDGISKTLVKQEEQLAYHIYRTNLLEKKLEPVEDHVKQVNGGVKLIGLIGLIAGIVAAIFAVIK
jgi:phage shock protein A